MGLTTLATMALAMLGILGACFSRILTDEFKAWQPFLIEKIISIAVGRVPQHFHERLAEEWRAHVNDTPGDLGKLSVALGLIWASRKLSNDARRSAAEDRFREAGVALLTAMRANLEFFKLCSNYDDDDEDGYLREVVVAYERSMRDNREARNKVSKLSNNRLHEAWASLERDFSKSPSRKKLYEAARKAWKLFPLDEDPFFEFLAELEYVSRNLSKGSFVRKLYIDVQDPRLQTCSATADGRHRVPNGTLSKFYGLEASEGCCALCGQRLDPAEVPDC